MGLRPAFWIALMLLALTQFLGCRDISPEQVDYLRCVRRGMITQRLNPLLTDSLLVNTCYDLYLREE